MIKLVNNIKTALLLGALFGLLVAVGSFWGTGGMIVGGAGHGNGPRTGRS